MLIGIDVGGTNTDAALVQNKEVIRWAKVPTQKNLLASLLEALDQILEDIDPRQVQRVGLSTTLITNLIAEDKMEAVGLLALPGPGVNPANFSIFDQAYLIPGAMDYHGREIMKVDFTAVDEALQEIQQQGIKKLAIVGKFSVRNKQHEQEIAQYVQEHYPEFQLELGHRAAGKLNFPRRAITTCLTAATRQAFEEFAIQMQGALLVRGVEAPVYILKADGGTMPLEKAVAIPVETIFSGPAASTMGVMALMPPAQTSVVVDIGGTTTDLALILSGTPLVSSKGAQVHQYRTQIRAFAVRSMALGGDSLIQVRDNQLQIGPMRAGAACCLGGPGPTPTDALRVLKQTDLGDEELAHAALLQLSQELWGDSPPESGDSVRQIAEKIIRLFVEEITRNIQEMFLEWEQEPAYRVWELLQPTNIRPQNVVGIGGAAPSLIPLIAEKLGNNCQGIISEHAQIANALGAALARPTLTVTLRVNTEQSQYTVAEDGTQVQDPKLTKYHLEETENLAQILLQERAESVGLNNYSQEAEVTHRELFNMIRGWNRVGRLIDVVVQIPAGVISE